MSGLLTATSIGEDPTDYVRQQATILVTFDRTQDSGNVSWLVDAGDQRLFVKTAGPDAPPAIWHFGTRLSERAEEFCGSPALAAVVQQAVRPEPTERPATVAAFADAWRRARPGRGSA